MSKFVNQRRFTFMISRYEELLTINDDVVIGGGSDGQDVMSAVVNILEAGAGEAAMMARCTGKTSPHSLEPKDLRALTLPTRDAADVLLVGKH